MKVEVFYDLVKKLCLLKLTSDSNIIEFEIGKMLGIGSFPVEIDKNILISIRNMIDEELESKNKKDY